MVSVRIASQLEADFQLAVLDNYASQSDAVKRYRQDFKRYLFLKRELEELINREARSKGELDYNRFLLDELNKAALKENEQEEAEQRLELLHIAGVKTAAILKHFLFY